jgi:alkanesulfonate monooxygenase SsuD/methylene tetrahydromethanopterin reductase-like flavin-dependent oxidoreductase (luciferase family)
LVLPVHHPAHVARQAGTLDYLSGGRVTLGVGLGRDAHYSEFGVPVERRVRRFTEGVELMRALWNQPSVTYHGQIYQVENVAMLPLPVQQPLPVWFGGSHPNALKRTAALADGWMGSGNSGVAAFKGHVALLKEALAAAGRDPQAFPISKRVFLSVHQRSEQAYQEVRRYMEVVYRNAELAERSCLWGTPAEMRNRLADLAASGVNHLLLHPICRPEEQVEALAEVVGLV